MSLNGQLDLGAVFLAALDDGALDVLAGRLASRLAPHPSTSDQRADEWLDARRGAAHVGLSLNSTTNSPPPARFRSIRTARAATRGSGAPSSIRGEPPAARGIGSPYASKMLPNS